MNAEETEIYEFLKTRDAKYVSVNEISGFLGRGRRFQQDRNWAHPILRRMEIDGIVEANLYGEYRLKGAKTEPTQPTDFKDAETEPTQPTDFKDALDMPSASLGDTTIIRIQDV